ncbi:amidase [Agrobacterium tumefaciens]|nr:amidase [Agrobacterium tumefaciens]
MSGHELAQLVCRGDVSPVELIDASLARLEKVNSAINAFVTVTADRAREEAQSAEAAIQRGDEDLPPLFGLPLAVKDLTDTAGVPTTYGSVAFKDHVPEESDISWERLQAAGSILIGKTTTPEFGLLGVTQSRLTGTTSTPWDISRTSGGSSGGSAAAVASGIVPSAWGSDGGGSIRVPAASCGVVGFKASTGRIPTRGNSEPDTTDGPIARRVVDVAMLLDATVGPHPQDRFSLPGTHECYMNAALNHGGLAGKRIAYALTFDGAPVDPQTRIVFEAALAQLESDAGAIVEEVVFNIPDAEDFFLTYWGPEYAKYIDIAFTDRKDAWPLVAQLAEMGSALAATTVSSAMRDVKTAIYNGFAEVFKTYDFVVCPTTPIPPYPHGQSSKGIRPIGGGKSAPQDLAHENFFPDFYFHRNTEPPSHAGLPAISVPCGFTRENLPVGMQIIGCRFADAAVIAAAAAFEEIAPWWKRRPPL